MYDYDVMIAEASFAGLAVANQLRGFRVLLVDRNRLAAAKLRPAGPSCKFSDIGAWRKPSNEPKTNWCCIQIGVPILLSLLTPGVRLIISSYAKSYLNAARLNFSKFPFAV